MVGLCRIEERKPEQHSEQHCDRPEQVGEVASHAANIRLGEILKNLRRLVQDDSQAAPLPKSWPLPFLKQSSNMLAF